MALQGDDENKVVINNTYNGNEIQIFNERKSQFDRFKNNQQAIIDQSTKVSDSLYARSNDEVKDGLGSVLQKTQEVSDVENKDNDRLIASIQMVKDILKSNMQLRDDQLRLAEEHEGTMKENHQLMIENEDLRDKL